MWQIVWLHLITSFALIQIVISSAGDFYPVFQQCVDNCQLMNCTKDGLEFIGTTEHPMYLVLLSWDCLSECKYQCMWDTIDAFLSINESIPQFYGKWPFIRLLGIQEPASFIFSAMNLIAHMIGLHKFRTHIRRYFPLYWLRLSLILVSLNTWIWSCVFHARDVPFTARVDNICAFSMILMHSYCVVQRLSYRMSMFLNIVVSTFYLALFVNHAMYLTSERLDNGYNLKMSLIVGGVTVFIWCVWNFLHRKKEPYFWKCSAYFVLTACFVCFEIFDFAPILWTFDSHSIWHLLTAFICPIFYSFIIDDCKYLMEISEYKLKNP